MKHRLLLFTFLITCICLKAQTVRYLNTRPSGTADRSSWANASDDLQAIINASAFDNEVWVAQGLYKPTTLPVICDANCSPRDRTFFVKNGIKLFGGFTGHEMYVNERTGTNETILSGDFNDNDIISGFGWITVYIKQ